MRQIPMTSTLVRLSLGARAEALEVARRVLRGNISLSNLRLSEVAQVLAGIDQTITMLQRFQNPEVAKRVELILQEHER